MTANLKRTALYEEHKKAGAKLVEFGGWDMPISYDSVINEHKTVRSAVGLFDVSHMGEVFVEGKDAEKFLQHLCVNDVSRLKPGNGQYSAMLDPKGGFVDDLIIYRLKPEQFLLCVNASNTEKDAKWIQEHASSFDVKVRNESEQWSQIAVQGPQSLPALLAVIDAKEQDKVKQLQYTDICPITLFGQTALLARTGYTGEWGYEIYLPNAIAAKTWSGILATAPKTGAKPIGLGARDTLRLEACYLLYGNDMDETVTPLEAGISWAVKLDKNFIGRDVLVKQKEQGSGRKMVAFLMDEPGIARHGMEIFTGAKKVGQVTSASFLPTLEKAGGMALVSQDLKVGDTMEIDIRGKRKLAKIVKRPLYSAKVK